MNYLLDTNALSEAPKKRSDAGFRAWLASVDESSLFTSCLVLGEIQKGIMLVADEVRQNELKGWLGELVDSLGDRVVGVDMDTSLLWGRLLASGQRSGKTPPVIDALIAAQCMQHALTLVTHNVKDFEQFSELEIICPWSSPA